MSQIQAWLEQVHNAVMMKQWWLLASLALVAAVAGIRWVVPKVHGKLGDWLNTEHGAITLVFVTSILGAFGTALGGGVRPTWDVLWRALEVGMGSAVGYPVVKKWIAGMLPGIFGSPAAAAKALLPFVPIGFIFFASCLPPGYCKDPAHAQEARCKAQTETVAIAKQCALPETVKLIGQIFPQVIAALVSDQWSGLLDQLVATLKAQGIPDALTLVTCAVQTVEANGIPPAAGKAYAVPASTVKDRAHQWNAAHPIPAAG